MAKTKAAWKAAIWCGSLLVTGVQFVPGPRPVNPPIIPAHTIQGRATVPAPILRLLDRSCMDCHSNRTRWPWYSRVAPAKWLVASDVARARAAVNFSEWNPQTGPGMLAASCALVESGGMPRPDYVLLHPAARLTHEEKRQFCEWTHLEMVRSLIARRKSDRTAFTGGVTQEP